MTDAQINAFLAVIQYGNFTRAAESLFISEPALSRSISLLEQELNCTLIFRKKGGRVQDLTEAGKRFLQLAEQWKLLLTESKSIARCDESQLLRVIATESFNERLLTPIYQYYLENYPNLHLLIDTLHTGEAYRQIAHNLFDIAFVSIIQESKHVEYRALFKEHIVMVCPKGMYKPGPVHPSDLNPAMEILSSWAPDYQVWGEFWFGHDSRSRLYTKTLANLNVFITENQMWAFMPISLALHQIRHYDIEMHEVSNGPPDRICYALQNRVFKNPEAELFIDKFCNHVASIDGIELVI